VKTELTLTQLAETVQAAAQSKRDFIAPASKLEASLDGPDVVVSLPGAAENLALTTTGHNQLASHIGIPKGYYDRLKVEMPDLLVENVNRLVAVRPEPRLLRTTGTALRAVLSDRYLAIDNYDVASSVLTGMSRQPELKLEIKSSAVTEEKLWVKAITYEKQTEISKGDWIAAGFAVSNSEVGMGTLTVEPFIERLVCTNGMRVNDAAGLGIKRRHVGSKLESDQNWSVYTDETKRNAIRTFLMQISDVIAAAVSDTTLERIAAKMRAATGQEIKGSVEGAIQEVKKVFALTEGETTGVLEHLIRGGDLSKFGLSQAVTRAAEDQEDYNRASEFESFGWDVINLNESDWKVISTK
jgi:hypothetical protein